MVVGAGAEETRSYLVRARAFLHAAQHFHFRHAHGMPGCGFPEQVRRNLVEQFVDIRDADDRHHGCHIGCGVWDERHRYGIVS